jgi:drug/metabolite transporter (DMT)-like permease
MSANWRAGGYRLGLRQWPLACLRGAFVAVAQLMFYLSLARLAFATATTIAFSMSLFAVALSVPILGDRVGWVRWAAVMVGFAGVAMVIGPGADSFSLDALLPVGAAVFYALTAVTSRLFDEGVPTPLVNLYSTGAAAIGAVVLCLSTGGFTPIAANSDLLWIAAMGGLGGSGVLCLVVSFRMTEPSNLAPFNYFGILFAFALGWIFTGGLLVVWRERRVRKRAAAGGLRDL